MIWLEELRSILDLQALVLILILLVAARAFSRVLSGANPVESWHFIASRGEPTSENKSGQWGDPKKLAVVVFIFASTVFVGYTFWAHPVDNFWIVAVFFGWAIAMLGIDVFAAWARSFVDRRFGERDKAEPALAPPPPPEAPKA